jgi:O-antigen ligase
MLTAVMLVVVLAGVLLLCVRAPVHAFAVALALFSFEGTVKVLLDVDGADSPAVIGAAAIDFALFASLLADRGRSPAQLWSNATTLKRVAVASLGAWLLLSLLQLPVSGDLVNGLEGLRVTQSYAVVALGGAVLAARLGPGRLPRVLLGVIALAVLYAGLRGVIGPADAERAFSERRTPNANFDDLARDTGSFTAAIGLVSFLVPAGLLCLAFALLGVGRRAVTLGLFALAMTGLVASYVRSALFAVVLGAALLTVMLLLRSGAARRRGAIALATVAVVVVGGYGATLLAGEANPATEWRAKALAHPLSDYSVTTRFDHWGDTLRKVADEPFGSGIGTVGRATAHGHRAVFTDNSYLKVLREQGIAGGLLFVLGLGAMLLAMAVRLVRLGPLRRPVGAASLVAVSGFLGLMVMAEYIEQPGKVLAWALLGVAVWETIGRSQGDQEPWIESELTDLPELSEPALTTA